jgi:CO dehydrogenase/acetyl-CoA synthase gamma subunit (corrinoid Fe-S protein)
MAFEIPKTLYNGKIREIRLGKGDKSITVGGEPE